MARTAIHLRATVGADHKVEVLVPEPLQIGDEVDVVLLAPEPPSANLPRKSILEILDAIPPNTGMFKTAKEVDDYIRGERDSWDR